MSNNNVSFPDLRLKHPLTGNPTLLLNQTAFETLTYNQILYVIFTDIQLHSPTDQQKIRKLTSLSNANSSISTSKDLPVGCSCRKSKCLKLYCQCFAEGGYCKEGCRCQGCQNKIEFEIERSEAIIYVVSREPTAFGNKKQSLKQREKGCTCKKSGCQKKYCECYSKGVNCGEHCKCQGCLNCKEKGSKREGNCSTSVYV